MCMRVRVFAFYSPYKSLASFCCSSVYATRRRDRSTSTTTRYLLACLPAAAQPVSLLSTAYNVPTVRANVCMYIGMFFDFMPVL